MYRLIVCDGKVVWLFKSSRLLVALTLFPPSVLFETEILVRWVPTISLKFNFWNAFIRKGSSLCILEFDRVLSVRTTYNVDFLN